MTEDDDILEEIEDANLMTEISFDDRLQELASNIRAGCDLSTTYNPAGDIIDFIENNTPDVLITTGPANKVSVSVSENSGFGLGKVLHLNIQHADSNLFSMKELEPIPIPGDATTWQLSFASDAKKFLEDYLIINS